ncbi:TadE/TadG family type IV pilus assembly protein [Nocardioides sp. SYSU D00038]|uniref:TadE/TadG family type IV pilus assembly protein n=1 Tax=Nocardioides sp. SYSU D00038 TaxID=2812554 RepID=UPI0019678CB0|nr:TadE family protein [Nocardioides sp. SYSU D00038]
MSARVRSGARGAVALEAALVTPLVMLLALGIVELAMLVKNDVALTSAVRTGGRTASANAGAGPGGTAEGGDCLSPCSPTNAPMLAQLAANAIERAGTALPRDSIEELWIYRANDEGYPGADGSKTWTCASSCVRYVWVPAKDSFRYYGGSWASAQINACPTVAENVGIYLRVTHSFVTGLFVDEIDLEDHAVFTFEPLPTLTCAPGKHP